MFRNELLVQGLHAREALGLLFLEVFGNCLLRGKTADYVEAAASELISLVTAGGSKWDGVLRVDSMKHKERDDDAHRIRPRPHSYPYGDVDGPACGKHRAK